MEMDTSEESPLPLTSSSIGVEQQQQPPNDVPQDGQENRKEESSSARQSGRNRHNYKASVTTTTTSADTVNKNNTVSQQQQQQQIIVKIVSAKYGPCEGRRLLTTGELITDNDPPSSVPYTRDVTPFLRALFVAQQIQQQENHHMAQDQDSMQQQQETKADDVDPTIIRVSGVTHSGMKRAQIPVLDQMKGMNACFGDPCPGVSKRLHISYIVAADTVDWAASAEIHHTSFAEHEKVLLHRRRPLSSISTLEEEEEEDKDYDQELLSATEVIEAKHQSTAEATFVSEQALVNQKVLSSGFTPVKALWQSSRSTSRLPWRLPTTVSEVVLPLVMEYLKIPERVHGRLVCRAWRSIIRDFGVATVIDNNDPHLQAGLTRPFLIGLLKHSYSSLESLFLSGFEDLEKSDLHSSIPHLRKLRSLDVSRCIQLDDSTLQLLANHCHKTLEVLYLKGLRRVTDIGMMALCDNCAKLRVLDISNIPLSDVSGTAIGQKFTNLSAVYMRDNFCLTNDSIASITTNCHKLEQLTLWGCTRLREINFAPSCREKLFLLNLWGCHGLDDNAATALEGMSCLRTLIVSECHRLTDAFFTTMAKSVPRLSHLHARYCKRLSDTGVGAIAQKLESLYSLDLSFCTKVSPTAVQSLLETRGRSLAELRLQSCRNLDIGNTGSFRRRNRTTEIGRTGLILVRALQSHGDSCCLSALDLRNCGGQPRGGMVYHTDDPFVKGMVQMGFHQYVPGFFHRPARWNANIESRLVGQLLSDTHVPR